MSVKFETNIPVTLYFPFGDAKEVDGNYGTQFAYTVKHGDTDAGQKDQLFASERLHQQLQGAAGLCPGGSLKGYAVIITKKEAGTKKYFDLCWIDGTPVEPLEEAPAPVPAPVAAVPPAARRAPVPAAGPPAAASHRPSVPAAAAPAPAPAPASTLPPTRQIPSPAEAMVVGAEAALKKTHPVWSEVLADLIPGMTECIQGAMKTWADAGFDGDLPTVDVLYKTAACFFIEGRKQGAVIGRQHRQGHRQPAAESGALPEPADQWGPPAPDDEGLPF